MGFLRSGRGSSGNIPLYTGLQIQTSSNAVPIAILWGANKTAPNVIWTGGFTAVQQNQNQGGGGGKGGGNQVQGYNYFTGFIMAVCEGPIVEPGVIWLNNSKNYFNQVGIDFAAYGGTPQTPWSYLFPFGEQYLGYNGVFYFAAANFALGSSPSLPQFSIEVRGKLYASSGINADDADPALVIQDFLTNAQYGVLFPSASIDATTLLGASGGSSYQAYCKASFLGLSPVLANQEAANSILARWLQLTNSAAVWSGGKLKFIPYGDTTITGNLKPSGTYTFNPNVTPLYNLADDDFIHEDGKDPIEVVRSDPYASYNWQRLQISQRYDPIAGTSYDAMPIDAFDQNAIELYGLRRASDITAGEICDPFVGQKSAQLILQRGLYIRNAYHFKLSFEYCLLEPMDLVTVTDSVLGLTNVAIRIVSIEEDDAGLLAVTAEEFPGGTATAVQYPVQGNGGNSTNQAVVPARVNVPTIYEPPASLSGGVAQVWAAVSGGIAPAYFLAEDGSTGAHRTNQTNVASVTAGTTVLFSIYAQAVTRSALRIDFNNGSANIGCDFNLATGSAGTPDAGISSVLITNVGGATSSTVTITIASPAVVTWANNGLGLNEEVTFSTTGALPTGLTAGTVYYAIPTNPASSTFGVATTPAGAAINTSGTQSGTHTCASDIWYQCSISGVMAGAAAPKFNIRLENPVGTISYAGTAGNGLFIWGAEVSFGGTGPTFLPAFSAVIGATITSRGAATPEGASGFADPNWGGAFVWISTDGTTYGNVGTFSAPARQGFLTAALPAPPGANPDTTDTLSVSLVESGGTLAGTTTANAQNGVTLCLVDNELLSYVTATLTGTNAYNLTTLYRGLYGTAAVAHLNGAPFTRVDGAIFKYVLPTAFIGVGLFMKFQSFNIFGQAIEDLSECAVYQYTPTGAGQPIGPVTQALLLWQPLDFRLVSQPVNETDQWGIVSDGVIAASVDLGLGIP